MKLTKDQIEAVRREFGISEFQTGEVPTFSTEGRNKLLAILVCYMADAMLEAEAPKPTPERCGGTPGKPP